MGQGAAEQNACNEPSGFTRHASWVAGIRNGLWFLGCRRKGVWAKKKRIRLKEKQQVLSYFLGGLEFRRKLDFTSGGKDGRSQKEKEKYIFIFTFKFS